MAFQRANARGGYDDFATHPTLAEAESNIPAIDAKWAPSHVTAKAVEVATGFVGTLCD